jgi:uncharacterized RDD family membrane protein YckC
VNREHIGKTCPYCQFPIKAESEIHLCTGCKIAHHRECWQENGGCTTLGCSGTAYAGRNNHGMNINNRITIDESDFYNDGSEANADFENPRPWVRYFARSADYLLFSMVAGFVIFFAIYSIAPAVGDILIEVPEFFLSLFFTFVWNFVEAFLLSTTGTTLGKWLLGVSIHKVYGEKLTYQEALARSFAVWIRGIGLGIPIVSFVTAIIAYNDLTGKDKKTNWDLKGGFIVRHEKLHPLKVIIFIAIFVTIGVIITQ